MTYPEALCYYHPSFDLIGPSGRIDTDVCIYGATPGGIIAAIQLAKLNHQVVLLEPGPRIGGMTSSGLGNTDIGNKAAVGGLAREFYRRVGQHYCVSEAWTFEPHVAEGVFTHWLQDVGVVVHCRKFVHSVEKAGNRVTALRCTNGLEVKARMFIDASYEGDLLDLAGCTHFVGREANAVYKETLNGAQVHDAHQFDFPVDPYIRAGDSRTGLLPGIEQDQPTIGAGDHRIQAYCFRMCLTDEPANRLPFLQPRDFHAEQYVLLQRYLAAGWTDVFSKFDRLRVRHKTDTNNHGAVSTDFIGQNYQWPRRDYATREKIFQAHVTYQQGLHWFMANSPAVPKAIRDRYAEWGLCRDEFTSTGGWPTQLYVREARRLRGDYVMTEHECRGKQPALDSIGLAAYTMDSHNCQRFVREGLVRNEGDVQAHGFPPYPISYRSIVPRQGECENLLVPVCLSASHIAYGSIRMEPVFMILGQSAALAADMAMKARESVQRLPYVDLRSALAKHGQILSWDEQRPVDREDLHAVES